MATTNTKKNHIRTYPLERSPLYGLSSKRKLAEILGIEKAWLADLDNTGITSQYKIFKDKETLRFITEPIADLLIVHRRLLTLFTRMEPPTYLHSAIRKRSYKTNAEVHLGHGGNVLKIDISKFFPSVRYHCVHAFFLSTLKCSPDIAVILAKLCTVSTKKYRGVHLPTGSCISPILSFLANRRMFDSIANLCRSENCRFSLYVDDITISGPNATGHLLAKIAQIIFQAGYGYHKIKTYHHIPAKVTGLIVDGTTLRLPRARIRKIEELETSLEVSENTMRNEVLAQLVGRLSEAEQIQPEYRACRMQVMTRYTKEWNQIVADRQKKAKIAAAKSRKKLATSR